MKYAEEAFLLDPDPSGMNAKNIAEIDDDIDLLHYWIEQFGWDKQALNIRVRLGRFNARQKRKVAKNQALQTRRLSRYRSEAEAQRRKTLERWIEVGFVKNS